ncbi:branched-chain amino acid ABC transporter permease [Alcaligenaceae bacterium LF4-65]|uniref:Branched-chain amino acid ABC transporter permease n=1 Tax=Zwartia hollandica TaxID=324606 RepID=A0A953T0X6_9BURK|nr:branched-chain amino acid ABC transporter permease [Zwartia hollandica]MBZ1349623.1 branched-chain amino acid ABC transporter permease [Zwartia hollandica]
MDPTALFECLSSISCIVTQTSTGLIVGALLFLVAAGLTLIFGVLGVINFSHGSFYMLGAYIALSAYRLTDSYLLAALIAGIGVGLFSLIFERFFMRRVYNADVLLQLLVCYAFILILDDAVKIIWGHEFQSMGMPAAFQTPPLFIGGGIVPVFYVFMMGAAAVIGAILWYVLTRTRIGKIVRAAAHNPTMTSVLGLNTTWIYAGVFVFGGALAGLAGALAAPVRSMSAGMGFSILIESFIVTVIGGMGSVSGALVGALLIGLVRSFGSIGFPLFVEGIMFLAMALILILKPSGLLGKEQR